MPKINRIRIINFSYNNDHRHIIDETFNFYGGENGLLSLANGGGKSVLVQLFLQPVVPGMKIQGRPLADFFKRRKQPSYVLLEWKLDGGGGYLLTGIALASMEVRGLDGDERSRLRYFTFTTRYPQSHAFDIAHIELVKKRGGLLEVMPFREAAGLMGEKARRDPLHFGYFTRDDGELYASHLASFGISQEEWRNVIARINDSEGGLEEIFLKCRNSDQLLNTWLIKTVEKTLYRDREDARRLEEMLGNLVSEIIENEEYIIDKEILEEFSDGVGGLGELFVALLEGLEEERNLKGILAALSHALAGEIVQMQDKKAAGEREIHFCRTEKEHIQLEERSAVYYQKLKSYESRHLAWKKAEDLLQKTSEELSQCQQQRRLQQAARLRGEKEELQVSLGALEERLASLREEIDTDGRIKSLRYSLKVGYEELLAQLAEEKRDLEQKKQGRENRQQEMEEQLKELDDRRQKLSSEKGKLEERKRSFEEYEKSVEKKLGLSFKRNLFGELDSKEAEEIRKSLTKRCQELASAGEKLEKERVLGKTRISEAKKRLVALHSDLTQGKITLNELQEELAKYRQFEKQLAAVFNRHGVDFDSRFDREAVQRTFEKMARDLEERKYAAARERDRTAEALGALKQGLLHVPRELAAWLVEEDISFETGETYLSDQPEEIRRRLLEGNPLLPYALIMAGEDLEKVLANSSGLALRQVIPIITYRDLEMVLGTKGRLVQAREDLSLLCLYEGRMFEVTGLEELLSRLEREQEEFHENYRHLEEALAGVRADQSLVAGFDYGKDYRPDLERSLESCLLKLEKMEKELQSLAGEKELLETKQEELTDQLHSNKEETGEGAGLLRDYSDFLQKNQDYQVSLRRLEGIDQEMGKAREEGAELEREGKKLARELSSLQMSLAERSNREKEVYTRYLQVDKAKAAPREEGSVAELEKRLEVLQLQHRESLGSLEEQKKEKAKELERKSRDLTKVGLSFEEYQDVIYDEARADWLDGEIFRLEKMREIENREASTAQAAVAGAESSLKHALEEIKRLGAVEPLAPAEIKGDFAARSRQVDDRMVELEKESRQLTNRISKYIRLQETAARVADLGDIEPEPGFQLGEDPEGQLRSLESAYRKVETETREQWEGINRQYFQLQSEYKGKKQHFADIFNGLSPLWEKAGTGFTGCYYLYERVLQQQEMLRNLLRVYETRLANLERSKQDMVRQSFFHGLQIYEELNKIAECSRVRIRGKARPVEMLRIDMQFDDREKAMEQMKGYIDQCIAIVREDFRQGKKADEVQKTISRLMSSRELLNQLLGTERIPISAYKIELNMEHSRHKAWEDAIRENSGGEKFVVFFSVLAALMSYTRESTMAGTGVDSSDVSRVLVMDNPFGPISSEHLLQPLFDIAEKHNTQLICLSDLKQSSIMNCFNLIFMLKVRTGAMGGSEYLKIEEEIKNDLSVTGDENLEKAIFRSFDHRQITFFEDGF